MRDRKLKAAKTAFDIDSGITFIDTAEVHGSRARNSFYFGIALSLLIVQKKVDNHEKTTISLLAVLFRFIKERKEPDPEAEVSVATKFAALPWRLGCQSVLVALKDSLARLELSSVRSLSTSLVVLFSEKRLLNAYEQLKKRGIPLASNQVNYSLIYRLPEQNGVKAACDELGVTLIAYSPIAQGKT
ncbi:hypothetical protein RND71_024778 [Anisodus tanguticus]|uniref:NADP-dependent oxidoreductase domain-containing protein n=1 Tax=Anisodus tanguticus TaxID=243964 RepID=A0AAE1V587_9SOLA|nr:hypothetical protein RND71_024778 [Anisodus tanguticus]